MKVKVAQSCPTLCNPMDYTVHGILQARRGAGSLSLLHGIFPTQGSNPSLPHCRRILHQLSHKGSTRILEWVAYHFVRGSSWPRNWTGVSYIAGGFFTNWAIRERGFIEDRYLKTKIWVLDVLIAIGISLLLAFCQWIQLGNICMRTNWATWLRW